MNKDAYYFPHFSNARHDRKVKRIIKELGVEGYGIYFMLLEVLRDQPDMQYPMDDIDLLADEFKTSEQKVNTVICNYKLFDITTDHKFFSPKLIEYMEPYFKMKEQRTRAGLKSGEIRALAAKTPFEEKYSLPQIYILECSKGNEKFVKIGSTVGTISRRFSGHLPYDYRVVRQIFTDSQYEMEKEIHDLYREYSVKPKMSFSGDAECYDIKILSNVTKYQPKVCFSHERVFEQGLNENEQSKVKKSKEKESKEKERKFTPPILQDVKDYFLQKGYRESAAIKAFHYYDASGWKDSQGNKVKNWKQKMIGVWFKPEHEMTEIEKQPKKEYELYPDKE